MTLHGAVRCQIIALITITITCNGFTCINIIIYDIIHVFAQDRRILIYYITTSQYDSFINGIQYWQGVISNMTLDIKGHREQIITTQDMNDRNQGR
jgi:hypothetical protein